MVGEAVPAEPPIPPAGTASPTICASNPPASPGFSPWTLAVSDTLSSRVEFSLNAPLVSSSPGLVVVSLPVSTWDGSPVLDTWSLLSAAADTADPIVPLWDSGPRCNRSNAWFSLCFLNDLRYLNCIPQTSQVNSLSAGRRAR